MRGILTLASAGFAALLMTAPAWAARVDGGAIVGVRKGAIVTYAGVPYAAAAVGDLRWREPRPVRPWTGVRPARDFAPACMRSEEHTSELQSQLTISYAVFCLRSEERRVGKECS